MSIVWATTQHAVSNYGAALDSITSALTVCCRCTRTADAALMMIASRQTSAAPANEWWGLTLQGNIPRGLVGNASGVAAASGTSVMPLNTEVFYLMQWDGAVLTIKLDGAVQATAARTGALTPDTTPVVINGNANTANNGGIAEFFVGAVSDLRIYNRVLSDTEQQTVMAARGSDGIVNGLVGHWPMNEGPAGAVASSLMDISGNGLHATTVGSPVWGSVLGVPHQPVL